MTTTAWYYDFYEKGAFPHQQDLCKAAEWTKCNLEGRQLVSPTHLTGMPANPLTIRLLALREAVNRLQSNVTPINEAIMKQAEKKFSKGKIFEMGGTLITQQSGSIKTGGAPVEVIKISGKRTTIEWRYDITHLALYEFFTNFGSVLDRLAYEIDLLYGLQVKKVDWPKLVDTTKGKDKYWKDLNNKDTKLAKFIKQYKLKLKTALGYRNRLVHDGIIRITADIGLLANKGKAGLSVKLPRDPNNNNSPMDIDAIEFCRQAKANVLKLLGGSYKLMLQHFQTHGKPPWKN